MMCQYVLFFAGLQTGRSHAGAVNMMMAIAAAIWSVKHDVPILLHYFHGYRQGGADSLPDSTEGNAGIANGMMRSHCSAA